MLILNIIYYESMTCCDFWADAIYSYAQSIDLCVPSQNGLLADAPHLQ